MFQIWDEKRSLNIFQVHKPDMNSKFDQMIYNIVFKFKDRVQGSKQYYINLFPQSQVKLSYELEEFITVHQEEDAMYIKEAGNNKVGIAHNTTKSNMQEYIVFYEDNGKKFGVECDQTDIKILIRFLRDFGISLLFEIKEFANKPAETTTPINDESGNDTSAFDSFDSWGFGT